jgi:hypothetical protein
MWISRPNRRFASDGAGIPKSGAEAPHSTRWRELRTSAEILADRLTHATYRYLGIQSSRGEEWKAGKIRHLAQ